MAAGKYTSYLSLSNFFLIQVQILENYLFVAQCRWLYHGTLEYITLFHFIWMLKIYFHQS